MRVITIDINFLLLLFKLVSVLSSHLVVSVLRVKHKRENLLIIHVCLYYLNQYMLLLFIT